MRERARQFNGEMTIESSGKGTLFRVTIPVSKKEAVTEEQKTQIA
jgi:signal transduction histidine kinase